MIYYKTETNRKEFVSFALGRFVKKGDSAMDYQPLQLEVVSLTTLDTAVVSNRPAVVN